MREENETFPNTLIDDRCRSCGETAIIDQKALKPDFLYVTFYYMCFVRPPMTNIKSKKDAI